MIDYMLLEIQEQPQFLVSILRDSKEKIYDTVSQIREKNNIEKIILTGCGDSLCAALTSEFAFAKQNIHTRVSPPLELSRYLYGYPNILNERTLLIPISVSGQTPRVIESINAAKSRNCSVLSITNNPESPVAQLSDNFIYAKSSDFDKIQQSSYKGEISSQYVGYEHDVPQTKSYTVVQLSLLLIASSFDNSPNYTDIESIPNAVKKIVQNPLIRELGENYFNSSRHIFSAYGPNYGNALFAEYKMYEFSLLGFSKEIEEYCHTAYFITEKGNPIMFMAPEGESHQRVSEISPILKNTIEAYPIILSNKEPQFDFEEWVEIPYNGQEEYSIIPYSVVAPLFAYWIAKLRGLNVNTFKGGIEQEKYVEGSFHTIRESKIKTDY